MKLDMELVRLLLSKIELLGIQPDQDLEIVEVEGYTAKAVSYHVWLLQNGGYVIAKKIPVFDEETREAWDFWSPCCLTWQGQEFFSTVQDTEIWRQTKEATKKGGGATIELVGEIAKAFLKKQLRDRTGLEI